MKQKQTLVEDKIDNVVVESDHDSDGTDIEMGGQFRVSQQRDTSVKSIFKETRNPDLNENVSDMNVNINLGA